MLSSKLYLKLGSVGFQHDYRFLVTSASNKPSIHFTARGSMKFRLGWDQTQISNTLNEMKLFNIDYSFASGIIAGFFGDQTIIFSISLKAKKLKLRNGDTSKFWYLSAKKKRPLRVIVDGKRRIKTAKKLCQNHDVLKNHNINEKELQHLVNIMIENFSNCAREYQTSKFFKSA